MKNLSILSFRILLSAVLFFPALGLMAQVEKHTGTSAPPSVENETKLIQSMRKDGATNKDIEAFIEYRRKQRLMMASPEYKMWKNNITPIPNSSCANTDIGVENGNFGTWVGFTGSVSSGPILTLNPTALPVTINNNQIVISPSTSYPNTSDPCADVPGFPIPLPSPTGGSYSIKLGPNLNGYLAERIEHTFVVQPTDTNFVYQYAVVFEDPGHPISDQPFMEFVMYDQFNNVIPCSYQKYVAAASIPGFQNSVSCFGAKYKPWTTVGVNLSPYVGQSIKVQCTSADCAQGGHWGYAYLDFMCGTLSATTQFCINDSVLLTAPADPSFSYSWSTGQTTSSIYAHPPLGGDTVVLNVIPASNCGFYLVFVLNPTIITPTFTYTVNCNNVSFNDNSTITGGTITGYSWSFPSGSPATGTGQNPGPINYPTPGTYTATCIVTSQAGCSDTSTGSFTILPPPVITATSASICGSQTATLCASGGTSYTWIPSNQIAPCITVSTATASSYTIIGTNANGCSATTTANVITNALPTILAGPPSSVCALNNGVGCPTLLASGGITYAWSPTTGLSNVTGSSVTACPTITTVYTVTGTNASGCSNTANVTVTALQNPQVTATGVKTICIGVGSAQLGATSNPLGAGYAWSPGTGLSCTNCPNPIATPSYSNTYTVTVTDVNGCTNTGVVAITVGSIPFVSAIASQSVCTGTTAQLNANTSNGQPPYTYYWTPPNSPPISNPNVQNPTANPATTTTFVVNVTDAYGCKDDTSTVVYVNTIPSISFAEWTSVLTCDGYIIPYKANVSSNGQSVYWDFGDGTSLITYPPNTDAGPHSYPFNGTYIVSAIVINGACRDTIDTTLVVGDLAKGIGFCPANVFTPNNDKGNYNECFRPAIMNPVCNCTAPCTAPVLDQNTVALLYDCMNFEVYDRWGIKMFETADGGVKCWDGKTKSGHPAKEGTYYYIAKLGEITIRGYVELLR